MDKGTCKIHGAVPMCLVCNHIANKTAEEFYFYYNNIIVCDECFFEKEINPDNITDHIENIKPMCVNCMIVLFRKMMLKGDEEWQESINNKLTLD